MRQSRMKTARITIRWPRGLHMREAGRLVQLAQRFRSEIRLRLGTRIADPRSILSLMILSANLGADLDIEAAGNDEREAVKAVEEFFTNPGNGDDLALEERAKD